MSCRNECVCIAAASVTYRLRLYPELPAAPAEPVMRDESVVRPFTEEQLRSLYYNYELEHLDQFTDTFLQVSVSVLSVAFSALTLLDSCRTVGWAPGRASGLIKLSDRVLVWLSVCWLGVRKSIRSVDN